MSVLLWLSAAVAQLLGLFGFAAGVAMWVNSPDAAYGPPLLIGALLLFVSWACLAGAVRRR